MCDGSLGPQAVICLLLSTAQCTFLPFSTFDELQFAHSFWVLCVCVWFWWPTSTVAVVLATLTLLERPPVP